jgi:hypothetical protein
MLNKIKNLSSKTKVFIVILALPLVIGGGAFAYWTISPLFYDVRVSEDLPVASEQTTQENLEQPLVETVSTTPQNGELATDLTPLASAAFIDADSAHKTSGTANVIEVSANEVYVRFEDDFKTTNGPDLYVWLTKDGNVDNGYVDLGTLKGNIGSQNYLVPVGTDLAEYSSVLIWCKAFAVLFGSAILDFPQDDIASMTSPDAMSEMMSGDPAILSTGMFVDADAGHKSSGTANVIEVSPSKTYVRFEDDFKTTNGPDLYVWLTKDGNVDNGYVDLGTLKGNIGSQNYLVPEGTDLSEYGTVLIWCKAFAVLFGTAVLN